MLWDPNQSILFLMFEEWLLILIFTSLKFDILNVAISQRQGRQNFSRTSKKGLNIIMKTYTHTRVCVRMNSQYLKFLSLTPTDKISYSKSAHNRTIKTSRQPYYFNQKTQRRIPLLTSVHISTIQ